MAIKGYAASSVKMVFDPVFDVPCEDHRLLVDVQRTKTGAEFSAAKVAEGKDQRLSVILVGVFRNTRVLQVLETGKEESFWPKLEVNQDVNNTANHISKVLCSRMNQQLTESVNDCPKYDALAINLSAAVSHDR